MANESVPVLCGGIKSFEIFMATWEALQDKFAEDETNPGWKPPLEDEDEQGTHPALAWIGEGLTWATKYYRRMDNSKSYVVTMCKFLWLRAIAK